MKKMNNKGFSLIELIIVIAIMAVLVAIIAPNLSKYLGSSKEKTDKKNLDEVKQQVMNAISDAETADDSTTAVKTGTYKIKGNGSTLQVNIASGNAGFNTILQTTLKTANTASKVNKSNNAIEFTITGNSSTGYEVTNVKFVAS